MEMKKYLLITIMTTGLMACHSAEKKVVLQTVTSPKITTTEIDPVCEMAKENTWTDYTIYENDSVWFCSENCKKGFMARPAKYKKNLKTNSKS